LRMVKVARSDLDAFIAMSLSAYDRSFFKPHQQICDDTPQENAASIPSPALSPGRKKK
jgi:hypothetical protein